MPVPAPWKDTSILRVIFEQVQDGQSIDNVIDWKIDATSIGSTAGIDAVANGMIDAWNQGWMRFASTSLVLQNVRCILYDQVAAPVAPHTKNTLRVAAQYTLPVLANDPGLIAGDYYPTYVDIPIQKYTARGGRGTNGYTRLGGIPKSYGVGEQTVSGTMATILTSLFANVFTQLTFTGIPPLLLSPIIFRERAALKQAPGSDFDGFTVFIEELRAPLFLGTVTRRKTKASRLGF